MALLTKIKLTPGYDWKSILLEDITGTGITGYGANQDPVTYREAAASGVDILLTRIIVTSPSGIVKTIELDATQAYDLLVNDKVISNTLLDYLTDDTLEDGIWKIDYVPSFAASGTANLTRVGTSQVFAFSNDYRNYINATHIRKVASTVGGWVLGTLYTISALDKANLKLTLADGPTTGDPGNSWHVCYMSTLYVPIAKAIKECLDNKIADQTLCNCDKPDCELVQKYLLYDAMFVNCKEGNYTKAQQIFDLLSKYCNCGC